MYAAQRNRLTTGVNVAQFLLVLMVNAAYCQIRECNVTQNQVLVQDIALAAESNSMLHSKQMALQKDLLFDSDIMITDTTNAAVLMMVHFP